jgi:hypothetical protein
MKLMLGNTPVKKMMIHNDTQDATIQPTCMQVGEIGYARGQKIVGTGKAFAYSFYGGIITNITYPAKHRINTVIISSSLYPIKMNMSIVGIQNSDDVSNLTVGTISINGSDYPITLTINDTGFTFYCEKTITLQGFCGKDEYI